MRLQNTVRKLYHHHSDSLLLEIKAVQPLFIKKQITDIVSILSRFISINLKRLYAKNNLHRVFLRIKYLLENTLIFKHSIIMDKLSRIK